MKFYTSVRVNKDHILERGYENGVAFKRSFKYKPYLFVASPRDSEYKDIHGNNVAKMEFNSISEAKQFVYKYKDVENYKVYGITDFEFLYIYDNYKKNFEYDFSLINIMNLDIETDSSNGYGKVAKGDKEINAITICKGQKSLTFGFTDSNIDKDSYIKCKDEIYLLKKFLTILNSKEWSPDIITGWSVRGYDIPYLYNRIKRVLGEEWANKLSPFGIVKAQKATLRIGKEIDTFDIIGISIVDYYEIYKKFATNERENYKLDYIAEIELGRKKLDYSKYKTLAGLYANDPKKYLDYNRLDALLIDQLENKLHYIEQIVVIAYIERINFENTIKTVKPWDVLIHHYLMDQNVVIPIHIREESTYRIMGGFVKEPKPGKYEDVFSVDFTSLYPSLAIQYNISPDTFVRQFPKKIKLDKIFNEDISEFTEELKKRNVAMTANGCLFKRDNRGFIPSIMKEFFDERSRVRNELEKPAKKQYELTKSKEDESKMLKYTNLQTAYKLINNSGYGALANAYFRWFANHIAEAITSSGQMTIQYVELKLNKFLNEYFNTSDVDYIVYCDTDSAYITVNNYIKKLNITDTEEKIKAISAFANEIVIPEINRICKELADKLNAFELTTFMKIEKICLETFFLSKKHYALNVSADEGIFYKEPKLKVTGLETVRSSYPKKARKKLEECYKLIFADKKDELIETIENFKKEFYKLPFEDVSKPSGVTGIEKYYDDMKLFKIRCPIHVRASIAYNELIKKYNLENRYPFIEDYDKIKYLYLKLPNPTFQNVIAIKNDEIPELPNGLDITDFIDYKMQFEKCFLNAIETVCQVTGFQIKKLDDFSTIFPD